MILDCNLLLDEGTTTNSIKILKSQYNLCINLFHKLKYQILSTQENIEIIYLDCIKQTETVNKYTCK